MERQFRPHESAYRTLASDWLTGGRTSMCWFGTWLLGKENHRWGGFWVRPKWWTWDVMYWNGHEYVEQPASSFDQTAIISGTTSAEIVRWYEQMAKLGVDCISTISGTFGREAFQYVQLEYFPPIHPNGLFIRSPFEQRNSPASLVCMGTKDVVARLSYEVLWGRLVLLRWPFAVALNAKLTTHLPVFTVQPLSLYRHTSW